MNTGKNHDPERSTTDTAKAIRKALKTKFGKAWKFSVRTRRFAGGSSIDVEIKAAPSPLYHQGFEGEPPYQTLLCQSALEDIKGIMDDHNRQDVDTMSDYWNVAFYGHASVCGELRRKEMGR